MKRQKLAIFVVGLVAAAGLLLPALAVSECSIPYSNSHPTYYPGYGYVCAGYDYTTCVECWNSGGGGGGGSCATIRFSCEPRNQM